MTTTAVELNVIEPGGDGEAVVLLHGLGGDLSVWDDYLGPLEWLTADTIMIDDPEGLTERLAVLRDAGVTRMIAFFGAGGMGRDLQLQAMRLFAEQVLPRL
jgi:pimeloyl-ACP methyl ester carboxylesterase